MPGLGNLTNVGWTNHAWDCEHTRISGFYSVTFSSRTHSNGATFGKLLVITFGKFVLPCILYFLPLLLPCNFFLYVYLVL